MNEAVTPKIEPKKVEPERRAAQRYVARFPVRAEWKDDSSGKKIVCDGATENVGQGSVLVTLESLPHVGSRVRISVLDEQAKLRCAATTEVIRIERHPGHPLAALQLLDTLDKWRRAVWESAAPPPPAPKPPKDEDTGDDDGDV